MDGTVLIADDDRTIRTVLTQALTRAGCKVHATSSLVTLMRCHPGARPLGPLAFNRLAKLVSSGSIIALGGINRRNAQMLPPRLIHGWAAIDAFKKKTA